MRFSVKNLGNWNSPRALGRLLLSGCFLILYSALQAPLMPRISFPLRMADATYSSGSGVYINSCSQLLGWVCEGS